MVAFFTIMKLYHEYYNIYKLYGIVELQKKVFCWKLNLNMYYLIMPPIWFSDMVFDLSLMTYNKQFLDLFFVSKCL